MMCTVVPPGVVETAGTGAAAADGGVGGVLAAAAEGGGFSAAFPSAGVLAWSEASMLGGRSRRETVGDGQVGVQCVLACFQHDAFSGLKVASALSENFPKLCVDTLPNFFSLYFFLCHIILRVQFCLIFFSFFISYSDLSFFNVNITLT